jgi:SAM-dependent methyltransferase
MMALVAGISSIAREHLADQSLAEAAVRQFPDVLRSCDSLEFDSAAQTVAYTIWHLADRYGRVTQVLDRLFELGHLPMRLRGATVLEVGAGPAPALYAIRDYYDDLLAWIAADELSIEAAPIRLLASIDRGAAWSTLLHRLSEALWSTHWPRTETPLPFAISYDNLVGFSVRDIHVEGIEQSTRSIEAEFERSGEGISENAARQLALEDGFYPPSAYDLIIMCNFLTNVTFTERFEAEISELARSLTPGGLLIVLGGVGRDYPEIYEKLRGIIEASRLRSLNGFDEPLNAQAEDWQRRLVSAQIRGDVAFASAMAQQAFISIASKLPADIVGLEQIVSFPRFRVHAWKNEWRRRTS